ncbi:ArnT family glycosyltransferase [Tellurirhabdus bombi]|uniref:ArnT family glycosyltransferase n=1 Tax=Tellurirhabdus bombi TaxID=2907205 RepID=UPI001F22E64F|nr:glycosyltransferase family 39 protein [Tellurirhabdus bombi]
MNTSFHQKPLFWQLLAIVLLVIPFFAYLGALPLDIRSDEPRRALVALEMMLSGDYLTPTLNGKLYFNKPPLYNWLIVASFKLFGNYSSYALRFPMAISLVGYVITIFLLVKRQLGKQVAFAVALMLATNARILVYDSYLGLIDTLFSWLTYTAFILVYQFDRSRNYWALFLITYILTALGFLMKGLPSVVFQGLTLLAYFTYTRQFKKLFLPAHFAGILVFVLIVSSYYIAYFTKNNVPLEKVAGVLFSESSKRTVVEFGVGQTLLHILTFPFEMQYYYAPWLLLVILLFRKDAFQRLYRRVGSKAQRWGSPLLEAHPFVVFNLIIFFVNFIIYWTSPQVYARYLLMLLPLLFTIFTYVYYEHTTPNDWRRRVWEGFLGVAILIVTLGCWTAFFMPETKNIPGLWWKCSLLFGSFVFISWQYKRQLANRLLILFVFLAVVRIGFNWIILPGRIEKREFYKSTSEEVARLTLDKNGRPYPLYSYNNSIGFDGATDVNSFHIEAVRGVVLQDTDQKIITSRDTTIYYIADSVSLVGKRYRTLKEFIIFEQRPAKLVQFE